MTIAQWVRARSSTPERRRLGLALSLWLVTSVAFAAFAGDTVWGHTAYNHYALLAEAWLSGQLHLPSAPPSYAGNNDFAYYGGQWWVVFPPFPAVLLLPIVWLAGSAERTLDGAYFIALAGVAPAVLFLALEKLRRMGLSTHNQREHVWLALLFAFGSVYFFTAVQGTVWYAAHVVAAGLAALYLYFALDAAHPLLAGLMLGLAFLTRTPLVFAAPLFFFEAWRSSKLEASGELDVKRLVQRCAWFAAPLAAAVALALVHNQLRFDDVTEFGYRYLQIRWRERIEAWGLFDYHYLAKNLGVLLTSLPYKTAAGHPAPFQINGHGLALWVTTPVYLWLLWPRRLTRSHVPLYVTTVCVALPTLFYQNTGWVQFGYRFSNDYAIFLFALLALGGYRLGRLFTALAVLAVAVNTFGALSFQRRGFEKYYFIERTQRVLYQPD